MTMNGRMMANNDLETMWMEAVMACSEKLSPYFPEGI
jgi:hypothetical protein